MAFLAAVCVPALCVLVPAQSLATTTAANWDAAQQRQVVAAGLLGESGGSFAGAGRLSAVQANAAMVALAPTLQSVLDAQDEQAWPGRPQAEAQDTEGEAAAPSEPPPVEPTVPVAQSAQNPVTVVTFDEMLIEELGLASVAAHVQATATAAGLRPPSYFGSEVVARFLELGYEHPVGSQRFDLFPTEAITRAQAAWSLSAATTG
jgi:hypothetical protein